MTLIEMMIVMFLIAMITGVVAFNYRATLSEGRAFKTQQGIEKVRTILLLSLADQPELWDRIEDPRPDSNGITPVQDDFRTTVGLTFEF